jgi:hypothetical protein
MQAQTLLNIRKLCIANIGTVQERETFIMLVT